MVEPAGKMVVAWGRDEAAYRRGLILSGCVNGVAPAGYSEEDGKGYMTYAVGAYTSLENWCGARDLSAAELQWLLQGLAVIWKEAEACLLSPGAFFLGPEQIFLDVDKGEMRLCVRPSDAEDLDDLRRSARLILEAIDYKEEACVELAYEFYHLCMKNEPSSEDVLAVCSGKERNIFPQENHAVESGEPEELPDERFSETAGSEQKTAWIDITPEPVTPEEEKRRNRTESMKKLRSVGVRILFAAAVALVAAALLKAGF